MHPSYVVWRLQPHICWTWRFKQHSIRDTTGDLVYLYSISVRVSTNQAQWGNDRLRLVKNMFYLRTPAVELVSIPERGDWEDPGQQVIQVLSKMRVRSRRRLIPENTVKEGKQSPGSTMRGWSGNPIERRVERHRQRLTIRSLMGKAGSKTVTISIINSEE